MAIGIFAADGVYWLGIRQADGDNSLPIVGEDKGVTRQSETVFGKQAVFASQFRQTMGNPLVQAGLVVVGAVVVAGMLLYVANSSARASQIDSDEA